MLDSFMKRMYRQGNHMGKVLKNQSDMIMDATFTRDVAFRECYILDKGAIFPRQDLESYKLAKAVFKGEAQYNPEMFPEFKPIDAKYFVHTYTTIICWSVPTCIVRCI